MQRLNEWLLERVEAGTTVTFEPTVDRTVWVRLVGPTHWFEVLAHLNLLKEEDRLVSFLEHHVTDGLRRAEAEG